MVLHPLGDAAGGQSDLAGDEVLATALGLMVEQDAVGGEHAVGLSVFLHDPEAVLLGHGVRAVGVEGRGLALGHLLHLAVELGGGCLVNLRLSDQAQDAHRLQNAQHADGVHVPGILRHVEAHLHMALGRQVIDLVRLDDIDDANQGGGIRQIALVEGDRSGRDQVVDAGCIGQGGPADDAVHRIALL